MIIATGTGRCGTTTIAKLFDMHHQYRIERMIGPKPGGWFWSNKYIRDPWPDRMATLRYHLDGLALDDFRDANNLYIHFIRDLYEIDPSVRIVLLVRDLFDFMRSAASRRCHTRPVFSYRPDVESEEWQSWSSWSEMKRLAWLWSYRNHLALDALKSIPVENWMLINTHEIYDCVDCMADFYGVPPVSAVIEDREYWNPTKTWRFLPPNEWNDEDRQEATEFARGCTDRLMVYGYRPINGAIV